MIFKTADPESQADSSRFLGAGEVITGQESSICSIRSALTPAGQIKVLVLALPLRSAVSQVTETCTGFASAPYKINKINTF